MNTEPREAIQRAAVDYFEGWYQADPERMARALHPALVKRAVNRGPDGQLILGATRTAAEMVDLTRAGGGSDVPGPYDTRLTVDHVADGIATVSAASGPYREFLHIVHTPDGWRIVNVLWMWADGHGPRA
jgi:hypothetical protein